MGRDGASELSEQVRVRCLDSCRDIKAPINILFKSLVECVSDYFQTFCPGFLRKADIIVFKHCAWSFAIYPF